MYFHAPAGLGEPPQPQIQYVEPFPNLRRTEPVLYQQAMAAKAAYDRLSWFQPSYLLLANATANAYLALDQADNIVVVPDEKSTADLLGPKLVKDLLKATGKQALKHILGKEFGTVLGVLDIMSKVITALGMADRRDLVNNQRGTRRKEAHDYKLRFFISLYISRLAPTSDRVATSFRIFDLFYQFRKLNDAYQQFIHWERNVRVGLPTKNPNYPTIRERRPGE